MKRLFALSALMLLVGCQTENSSVDDASVYSGEGSPGFAEAKAVLNSYCVRCHLWAGGTEAAMLADGHVVAGSPENSSVYYRLGGSRGTKGPKNMPQGGSLTAAELEAVETWISNIP